MAERDPPNRDTGAGLNAPNTRRRRSNAHLGATNRCLIALIVYLALMLDNILLTVIVPILPDYLASINNRSGFHAPLERGEAAAHGISVSGLGVVSSLAAPNVAYRLGGHDNAGNVTIFTKHPIPGKSMVNFSFLQPVDQKQLRHVGGGGTAAAAATAVEMWEPILSKSSVTGNPDTVGGSNNNNNEPRTKGVTILSTAKPKEDLSSENGSIGVLLSMKALVQLIFNPIVGSWSTRFGYRMPIVAGTFCLLMSSLVFAVGETYWTLVLARAIHGIGSACIGVCGMSLVAQHYPEEDKRSKVMGIILGSIALGVLLGYPFGGIMYDMIGKAAPFIIISTIIFLTLGMQLIVMDLSVQPEVMMGGSHEEPQQTNWRPLLESKMILAIVVAIWISTSTMAILEPCLPIWLMQYLKPTKWQLGTVFIPDSLGYFVGTNFFATIAYKYGQIKISCLSLILVGVSSFLIPNTTTVAQLLMPHFGLGLGIGIIDSALVPLLATCVDSTLSQDDPETSGGMTSYGTVYAIQQTSVSLAYCLAPLVGGELAQAIGFAWLMRIVGICNILYGPALVWLYQKYDPKTLRERHNQMLLTSTTRPGSQYNQLYNTIDVE